MIALILAATFAGQTPAAGGMTIQNYLRDPMHVYDENGAYTGPVDQKSLRDAKLTVVRVDGPRVLVEKFRGKRIELRLAEVLMDGVASNCTELASANRPANEHRAAGEVGSSSGLATKTLPCVK